MSSLEARAALVSTQLAPFGSRLVLGRKKLSEDVNVFEEGDAEIFLDSVSAWSLSSSELKSNTCDNTFSSP